MLLSPIKTNIQYKWHLKRASIFSVTFWSITLLSGQLSIKLPELGHALTHNVMVHIYTLASVNN